ncbi:MAG: sigma-54-dependent Fis family transcriptional regulator [Curvibacter sp. RIFCSPHIGHO2_12_FULL_63_18]|uniref:sigma-54-dependent Fis family transcriptional regulator n=1 Tax=Rhodoferax sp. TaxID=50421 RepID=UPI0008AAD679|nr:sigma-54-dependent Fis family transcriptional regulator [Rhodoferax sp.]OGO94661.1 MAG: sigma-54-dependent Fis family transcriptional regulator [Curvibacter sp. GWA2_63_95]OGP06938.1 MAG: sigma-54-dependent Fis family transcriptional regulator [Curvibacter sp. RIFCSPHIGHO2_12_FULL_63_18]HCX80151.1 sigma-54-dependent Fis family transcriptional regulator [Rhodoferax sp.]
MRQTSPVLALRQARQQLLETGQCPVGVLDERLARSWHRSLAAGLAPAGRAATDHAGSTSLRQALANSHALLAHSRPVMEYVFEQVRHSQSVVVLADPHGMLMHTLGDVSFVGKAERVALTSGASWHEAHRGTNAIGTALAERSAVEIHGGEHFLERNGFLTCAASPILSATGELMGVLDISGDHRHGHGHTLGLASTAARMIENRLMLATCKRNIRLHLHAQPEGIGSVAEGIVALSDDGWVVGANRVGLALLRLNTGDIGATPLERVLDVRLDDLLSRHKRRPQQVQQLRLHNGAVLFAQVQVDASALPVTGLSSSAPASASARDALAELDTGDARWRSAADKARRVVAKPIPVLIQGESGVGKELFARALHASGPRRGAPFVAINCGAIPESLIESELFGYVAGAFTGARKEGSLGRLREAEGGTLFLDEIGDMPLAMQTRLLRVLQERTVTPVGAGKAGPVDFALVCATHSKLAEAAERGTFRQDLYYRINGLTVLLPALRERSDFCALTERLLADLSPEREVQLAPELLARLSAFTWPGNLRQYASVLRTACAMLQDGEDALDWVHMPDDLVEALQLGAAVKTAPLEPAVAQAPQSLQALGHAAIQQALEAARGNVSLAARQLGISRQTLYRKLRA